MIILIQFECNLEIHTVRDKSIRSLDVEIKGSIFPILLNTCCHALFENINNNVNISVHLLHNYIIYINVCYNIQLQCIFIICVNI